MKTIKYLLICCLTLCPSIAKGQIHLPLKLVTGYGPFEVNRSYVEFGQPPAGHSLSRSMAAVEYNQIPASLTTVKKGIIWIDFLQFLYQNVKAGNMAPDVYTQFRKERMIVTPEADLSQRPIACFVRLVSGVNDKGQDVVLIDTNNDGRFDDETPIIPPVYTLDKDIEELADKGTPITYQTMVGGTLTERKIPLIVLKSGDRYLYSFPQYGVAEFKAGEKTTTIAISNEFRFPNFEVAHTTIFTNQKAAKDAIARKGQFLKIDGRSFENLGVNFSTMTLDLKEVENAAYGSQQGMMAIPFSGKDAITGKVITLADFKGKYLFIDFWGTWCAPCLAQLPKLSQIYSGIDRSKVAFLGIAGKDDAKKVSTMVIEKKIGWPNIVSDDINKIVDQYHITGYPTGILIGPDGKIINADVKDLTGELSKVL